MSELILKTLRKTMFSTNKVNTKEDINMYHLSIIDISQVLRHRK